MMEPYKFKEPEADGFRAIERRKEAESAIVFAARALEAAKAGPERLALWEPLMEAVRAYNEAEGTIARSRELLGRKP